ncbi:glutamate 5-kinase [Fonsecaea multimorphosa]|nr:glutamate 5-kinase [Fonsecaea multimorphosa]
MPPRSNTSGSLKKSSTSQEIKNSNNNTSKVADSAGGVGAGKRAMVPVEGEEGIADEGAVDKKGEVEEDTAGGEVEEAEVKAEVNWLFDVLCCLFLYDICIVTITLLMPHEYRNVDTHSRHFTILRPGPDLVPCRPWPLLPIRCSISQRKK